MNHTWIMEYEPQADVDEICQTGAHSFSATGGYSEEVFFTGCVIEADTGDLIAEGVSERNARLIAAAPEQNEALKLARKFIANGIELGYITMPADDDPASKTLDIIDAALAKAEGKKEATG